MECLEAQELIGPFADNELANEDTQIVAAHIAGCGKCQAELKALRGLSAQVKAMGQFQAPLALAKRIREAVAGADRASVRHGGSRRWLWPVPSTLAASHLAALAVGGAVMYAILSGSAATSDGTGPVLTAHIRALMADEFASVQSNNTHNVKPWFDGKLDYSPPVIDEAQAGYPLAGGRIDYLGARPVAALDYMRAKHKISVFVVPSNERVAPPATSGFTETEDRGYATIGFRAGGFGFWVVSDLNKADLTSFATKLRAAAAGNGESAEPPYTP